MTREARHTLLDQIEHILETIRAAAERVGNKGSARIQPETEKGKLAVGRKDRAANNRQVSGIETYQQIRRRNADRVDIARDVLGKVNLAAFSGFSGHRIRRRFSRRFDAARDARNAQDAGAYMSERAPADVPLTYEDEALYALPVDPHQRSERSHSDQHAVPRTARETLSTTLPTN